MALWKIFTCLAPSTFDINRKFLKSVSLPIKIDSPQPPYLHRIHEGFFYRLEENMDANHWWIHVAGIE